MGEIALDTLYRRAYGGNIAPYPFQRAVADTPKADILIAPTGLGKTAAVTLGWTWRRLTAPAETPKRLVWCLPMRTLVEQTARQVGVWMDNLRELFISDNKKPNVHLLMGGAVDADWRLRPEDPAIIVGTQDMLLSRALMRGYAMSRFGWPIDYGLLHTDALWVYDEVQLMGAGLATSAQLEAFRRREDWRYDGLARSLWVSATLDPDWLRTAEFRREIPNPIVLRWNDGNPSEPPSLAARLDALKHLHRAATAVTAENAKKPEIYARSLAKEVAARHRKGTTTLVVVNTVRRAQELYAALENVLDASIARLLIHSRYRPRERKALEERLRDGAKTDRVVVATQAVEAGVDMTSAVLFTELAPWSSMVQRFGRSNRAGELNASGGGEIRWIDIVADNDDTTARPYEAEELAAARDILSQLDEVSPRNLPPPSAPSPPNQVIRPKDFEELFDTDADLSGYDLDISPFIRDGDHMSVSLFWRTVGEEDKDGRIIAERPQRDELCAAPFGKELLAWLAPRNRIVPVYIEDHLDEDKRWRRAKRQWVRLDRSGRRLRPGITLLLDANCGGYDAELGFVGERGTAAVEPLATGRKVVLPSGDTDLGTTIGDDPLALGFTAPVSLDLHTRHVASIARDIVSAVGLPTPEMQALLRAAWWHDLGKAYEPFQAMLGRRSGDPLLAKSSRSSSENEDDESEKLRGPAAPQNALRKYFRHELASALAFLQQHDGEPDADLVAFLIAAHHGKARMGLRALPKERPDAPGLRIARGVQDGDCLPEFRCGDELSNPVTLDLGLMEMGEDERGQPSWSARTQSLLTEYGPFRLAYLEALIRMADWRASAAEKKGARRDE